MSFSISGCTELGTMTIAPLKRIPWWYMIYLWKFQNGCALYKSGKELMIADTLSIGHHFSKLLTNLS